ncbi:hypothetical protein Sru01_61750 [Sphaerisporangium rufum]|uniref:DUF6879 domain-containing protein n=1 Tax=Sphaerisporangium rufum TaxID=1381558 RepID=A0A919V4H3_9ACTN|nr:DUF6879 family protein [Sphaerisporangium rufum]GII81193.1 hypothetical protein Sru01_61750 [Sphaerisporangium rufum]
MARSFRPEPENELGRLFQEFRYTAYRLETLQRYDVPAERAGFARFLAGDTADERSIVGGWIERVVSRAVQAGKRMQRVHVVELPLTDYLRFEFAWGYRHSVRAGEDVRILPVAAGEWPEHLPRNLDYWLFDSCHLVRMHYRDDGSFAGAERIQDPVDIVQAGHLRDVALHSAVRFEEYASRETSPSQPR